MHKFEIRLTIEIRKQVVLYKLATYAVVVNKALIIEREVNEEHIKRERNQKKRNRSNESQRQSNRITESANKRSASNYFGLSNVAKCMAKNIIAASSEHRCMFWLWLEGPQNS